jgi:hypothetical protein
VPGVRPARARRGAGITTRPALSMVVRIPLDYHIAGSPGCPFGRRHGTSFVKRGAIPMCASGACRTNPVPIWVEAGSRSKFAGLDWETGSD